MSYDSREKITRWTSETDKVKKMSEYVKPDMMDRKNLNELLNTTFVITEVRTDSSDRFGDFMICVVGEREYYTFSRVLAQQMMNYLKHDQLPVEVHLKKIKNYFSFVD